MKTDLELIWKAYRSLDIVNKIFVTSIFFVLLIGSIVVLLARFEHLPCWYMKGQFAINDSTFQNYAQRCGW